jgi:Domain of unknown function (DU1801)
MPSSAPGTVAEYLRALDPERRRILSAVRKVVNANLPEGYAEGVVYGMISWFVPLKTFPNTYNGHPLCCAALGAQKNYNSLYLMAAYGNPKQAALLRDGFAQHGLKLNMGKSCVRFKVLDDLPLEVIGAVIKSMPPQMLIDAHEAVHARKKPRAR